MRKLLLVVALAGFSISALGCAASAPPTPPAAPEAKDKPADAPAAEAPPAEAPAATEGKAP